jgi:hypothetical protein
MSVAAMVLGLGPARGDASAAALGQDAPVPRCATPAIAVLLAVAAAASAGCSGPRPADLFVVQRSGSIDGARLTMRITDDGGAYCNRGGRKDITSAQLIDARELRRELDGDPNKDKVGLAQKRLNLKPGAITTLSYRVRSEEGTVAFSDTSARQPQAFYRLAKLTRDIARGACGLPR